MPKIILVALKGVLLLAWIAAVPGRASASPFPSNPARPADLLALINQLRAANGLPAYRSDSALMGAAQSHSEYQAANATTSHTGKGGSRPRDRAVGWGYGGGGAVYVSENIASGTNMSADQAISIWQGDGLHLSTMLSPNYRDAGVGVAEADGVVYYTLDVGYVAGDQSPATPNQGGKPGSTPASPPGTTVAAVMPLVAATPHADGSIFHEVQPGQALWNISAVYKVSLPYLLTLNDLNVDTLIYPGDKLLIRPPDATPTPKASPTVSQTQTPTAIRTAVKVQPTSTLSIPAERSANTQSQAIARAKAPTQVTPPAASTAISSRSLDRGAVEGSQPSGALAEVQAIEGIDPLLLIIGGLVVVGTLLLLLGRLWQRDA